MPRASNRADGVSPVLGMIDPGDVVDAFLDLFDKPPKKPSQGGFDLEGKLIETIVNSAKQKLPGNKTIKVVGFVVLGLKVLKVTFGGGDGETVSVLAPLDVLVSDDRIIDREAITRIVREVGAQLSGSGIVVMDPVWLADPAP